MFKKLRRWLLKKLNATSNEDVAKLINKIRDNSSPVPTVTLSGRWTLTKSMVDDMLVEDPNGLKKLISYNSVEALKEKLYPYIMTAYKEGEFDYEYLVYITVSVIRDLPKEIKNEPF